MGIQDRDCMKRRREDDGARYDSSATENALRRFLQKYPRFFLYLVIAIGVLIVLAAIATKPDSGN